MVGEVVASEGIDQLDVTGEVSDGDRDDLAITRRVCERGGTLEQIGRIPREQRRCDQGGHVVTELGLLHDLRYRARLADCELMDHLVRFGGHVWSIDPDADTGLTRAAGHTLPW